MNRKTTTKNNQRNKRTKGVETLLGEPKKAIITLSIPMIIAMSANTVYNLVDALWVSGFGQEIFTNKIIPDVGPNALAAVGFVLPFFMMIMAISTGLGLGGGSAISRRIGAKDKSGADNVAIHSIILIVLLSIVFTIVLFSTSQLMFSAIGAADTIDLATSYGNILFAGSIVIFFTQVAYAILRAEGDANRSMYAMMFGAGLNIILDPIFIYTFEMGVAGAAYATVLSMAITSFILIYWLFLRKDTYVSFHFKKFSFKKDIIKDIFKVGLPASIQQISMSITMLIIIRIITLQGVNEIGVAAYNTGWRVVMIGLLPLLGLATAVTSVTGAAFGSKLYGKLNTAYLYAIKIGFTIEIILSIIIFIFAAPIAAIFTTSADAAQLNLYLVNFLRITSLFYPGAALGIVTSAMFQGTGKGINSLIATLLRTIILTVFLSVLFTFVFNLGLTGIWWALVIANLIGSLIGFTWGKYYVNNMMKKKPTT
jgi:putative MATE family efflux protein